MDKQYIVPLHLEIQTSYNLKTKFLIIHMYFIYRLRKITIRCIDIWYETFKITKSREHGPYNLTTLSVAFPGDSID